MKPGIHLVHKPVGPTSFSLLKQFDAGTLGACHGGALDPFASGLLLVLMEPATKLFDYLHGVPKVYEATVKWGQETDNGDPLGKVTFTGDASMLSAARLEEALAGCIGWKEQIPPATSNKRIGGERAYAKAHRGEVVVLPASRVYLHSARWVAHDLPRESRLEVVVRGGYYLRSLARDLGRTLGCGAHLGQLHRSAIGPWKDPGPGNIASLGGRELLPWLAVRLLSDQDVGDLRKNRQIPAGNLLPPDWPLPREFVDANAPVRGFHGGQFCFLLRPVEDRLHWLTALHGGL